MRNLLLYIIGFCAGFVSFPAMAQTETVVSINVNSEKEKLLRQLKPLNAGVEPSNSISAYLEGRVDNIYYQIQNNNELSVIEKEKALRSLAFLIEAMNKDLIRRPTGFYDIPEILQSYQKILSEILTHQSLNQVLSQLPVHSSELMSIAFSQYSESGLIDDYVTYKRVLNSPEFILQFLQAKPAFRFADPLLLQAAAHDPLRFIFFLKKNSPGLKEKIRHNPDPRLQQLISMADDKNVADLVPFIIPMVDHLMTEEEILEKRKEPLVYFQLLTNTLMESLNSGLGDKIWVQPLRDGIKSKALDFYVNEINDLHASPEEIRFASIKTLRPEDLYYIITSCKDELYTSSYLGLYKRLMIQLKTQSIDSFFEAIHYDNLHIFLRLAGNYNVLADFLGNLSKESRKVVIHRFIKGIDNDEEAGLEKAMDIADSFIGLRAAPDIDGEISEELQTNLAQCNDKNEWLGTRLYGILLDLLKFVQEENGFQKLWSRLGNYEELKHASLENKNGEIAELVLFYGDEDGAGVFRSFVRRYSNKSDWEVNKSKYWVSIRALSGQPLTIYANMPLDIKEGLDIAAQDSLIDYLRTQSLEPSILVHRGHSYHLDKSIKRLTPGVKLAILGSCGSYNKALAISAINPDIQIIGSKRIGSSSVNDPIIDRINDDLVKGKDLGWPQIWKDLSQRFANDENTLNLFNEYLAPGNNLSLFLLKLFNSGK